MFAGVLVPPPITDDGQLKGLRPLIGMMYGFCSWNSGPISNFLLVPICAGNHLWLFIRYVLTRW